MNTQILIPLDDMTPENGATSLRPRSQIEIEYPTDVEEYRSKEYFCDLVCKLFHLNLELNRSEDFLCKIMPYYLRLISTIFYNC